MTVPHINDLVNADCCPSGQLSYSIKRKCQWILKKHQVFNKYISRKHPAYVKAARDAHTEMQHAKRNFEKKLAENIDTDRKSFYAYVRNRSRTKPCVGPLTTDSSVAISQPRDIAEMFNEYFASVFTVEDIASVPAAESMFQGSEDEKLLDIHISEDTVRKKLTQLRTDKAPGADNMSPRILVELKDVITFPVTQIMKLSFATGVIPDDWKIALVSPIYKNSPKCQVSNYRPISLTSIICKLFESIVRDALVQHLENNGLIRGTQHGFRRGGSCLSNLLQFLDRVTSEIDNGECVDVVYLDFAKAFDKVPHKRLMAKLVTVLVNSLVGVARAQHASVLYLIKAFCY